MSYGKGQIISDAELGPTQVYRIYGPPGVHNESEPENARKTEQVMSDEGLGGRGRTRS